MTVTTRIIKELLLPKNFILLRLKYSLTVTKQLNMIQQYYCIKKPLKS